LDKDNQAKRFSDAAWVHASDIDGNGALDILGAAYGFRA
jgi:hypothetical protein